MMGDGTEEQNLGERGNPTARIKKNEVAAAFNKARKAKQDDQFPSTASQCGDDNPSTHAPLKSNTAKSWFVPPIVVPAFLMVLVIARAFYSAFS